MKKLTGVIVIFLFLLAVSILPANANAIDIDLNDFFPDPTVTVAADGSSAALAEDAFFASVILSNDPGLGDPEVIVAEIGGVSQILSFDYSFSEGQDPYNIDDDQFGAFVIDAATGLIVDPTFGFFTQSSNSGTISWNLTSLIGKTLGLQFELAALLGDAGLDSTVTVSNVQLNPVPEPSTMILVGIGLFGLLGLGRKKFVKTG